MREATPDQEEARDAPPPPVDGKEGAAMDEVLLTPEEVAERTKLNVVTIRRLARKGTLRAYKLAGQWRIPEESVDRWLAESEPEPGVARPRRQKHPKSRWELRAIGKEED